MVTFVFDETGIEITGATRRIFYMQTLEDQNSEERWLCGHCIPIRPNSNHSCHCFYAFATTQRINNEIQLNLHSQLKGIAYAQKSARGARRLRTKITIESYPRKSGPGVPRSPVSTASAVSHSENLGVDCEGLGGGSE